MGTSTVTHVSDEMRAAVQTALECSAVCTEASAVGLSRGGAHAAPGHVQILVDCASICRTAADSMLRGSPLHPQVCALCADVCARCAEECEGFGDDPLMRRCAETCRRCASACRAMAGGLHVARAA